MAVSFFTLSNLVPMWFPLPFVGFYPAPPRPAAPAGGSGEREAGWGLIPLFFTTQVHFMGYAPAHPLRPRPHSPPF